MCGFIQDEADGGQSWTSATKSDKTTTGPQDGDHTFGTTFGHYIFSSNAYVQVTFPRFFSNSLFRFRTRRSRCCRSHHQSRVPGDVRTVRTVLALPVRRSRRLWHPQRVHDDRLLLGLPDMVPFRSGQSENIPVTNFRSS